MDKNINIKPTKTSKGGVTNFVLSGEPLLV